VGRGWLQMTDRSFVLKWAHLGLGKTKNGVLSTRTSPRFRQSRSSAIPLCTRWITVTSRPCGSPPGMPLGGLGLGAVDNAKGHVVSRHFVDQQQAVAVALFADSDDASTSLPGSCRPTDPHAERARFTVNRSYRHARAFQSCCTTGTIQQSIGNPAYSIPSYWSSLQGGEWLKRGGQRTPPAPWASSEPVRIGPGFAGAALQRGGRWRSRVRARQCNSNAAAAGVTIILTTIS
jgi:hypothetical protein